MITSEEHPSAITAAYTITIVDAWVLVANRRCKFSAHLVGKETKSFCLFTNYLIWKGFSSEKTKFVPLSCKRNNSLAPSNLTFFVFRWALPLFGTSMALTQANFSKCVAFILAICPAHEQFFYHCGEDYYQIWPSPFGSFLVLLLFFHPLFGRDVTVPVPR